MLLVERLAAAGCVAPEEEAAEMTARAGSAEELDDWARRREAGEPLAWIVGGLRFCGHWLAVDPGVYVPRHQTELLVEQAVAVLQVAPGRVVDLCAGSGAVAAALARSADAAVVAVDADRRAAANAARNGVPAVCADLAAPLRAGSAAVVTAVAPYVPTGELVHLPADVLRWEPRRALDGGADGLEVVRRVVHAAGRLLHPGGWLLLEIGGEQDELLARELDDFDAVRSWCDEDGDLRGVAARRR